MTAMGKFHRSGNNKLSKSQKKKLKFAKIGKKESTGKRGRLIVRNLPFKCNENDLNKHFESFGEIKDIHLLRRPDNKLVGCGFVEFKSRLSADKAAEQLNGKEFLGRPIYVERAVARERYDEPSKGKEKEISNTEESDDADVDSKISGNEIKDEIKEEPESSDESEEDRMDTSQIKKEEPSSDEDNDEHQEPNKIDEKNSTNLKKARLIVRNLSFKATEGKLREHFSQFGKVTEVKLLRRADGFLVGCGFVQFTQKQKAAKAIHHTSGKPFLGRPIVVDWALAKDKFKQMKEEASKKVIKKEDTGEEETKAVDVSDIIVKKEEESDDESQGDSETDNDKSESEEENEEEEENEDDESDNDSKPSIKQEIEESKKQRREDVDEGKTVFVKNLPFSATDEEFGKCMKQFGPVVYALVCRDKLTEHSKGSGFVKFKSKEDAEKCLSAGTELTLHGTILDPHPALKRTEAQKLKDKSKEKKDNRNLYLVKEGMIIAGTAAAQGVSVTDMERRLQLEQWKTTKLRNLNMLVSRNRLVVHNLPPSLSDKQLRKLFQRSTGHGAVIKEARVMRDLKKVDAKGQPASKGYGFVSFEKHEDALKALRSVNNNPSVFTPTARPIVSFSIENRSVLNTKVKRMERSRHKNPLCKDYKPDEEEQVSTKKMKLEAGVKGEEQTESEFAGITAKPGSTVKMRQKYKLKDQAQKHLQDVKKQKLETKVSRKMRRKEHIKKKQVEKKSTKKKKGIENDSTFTKLVDKYKTKMLSQASEKKKWYDG